jgi:hypothetical protein
MPRNGKECVRDYVMIIIRQPSPLQIMLDQSQPEDGKCFKYLGSMIINDAKYTREIRSHIAVAKALFNKKKTPVTSKLGLNLRQKPVNFLHLEYSFVWS